MTTTNEIIRQSIGDDRTKTTRELTRSFFSSQTGGSQLNNRKPMITFTFDDAHISNYTHAFPHFKANGFRATEFVIGSQVDVNPDRMTSEQIKELSNSGWEIACHSFSHQDSTNVSNLDLINDLILNKTFLEDLINKPVLTHAIPFGKFNDSTVQMTRGVYEASRRTRSAFMEYGDVDNLHQCPGWFFDTLDLPSMKSVIDDLMNQDKPKWLIIGLHGISNDIRPDLVSESELIELLEYIRFTYAQNGLVDVVPFYEGARRIIV